MFIEDLNLQKKIPPVWLNCRFTRFFVAINISKLKLTREEYVKRSKAMMERIDELHQEIEQLKTEILPEDNSSSKFETQLESIINMESFDREKIQKVIKKVIINGEDNIEIVWNTDDPFFK